MKNKQQNVSFPLELWEQLHAIAKEEGGSIAAIIRKAVYYWLSHREANVMGKLDAILASLPSESVSPQSSPEKHRDS